MWQDYYKKSVATLRKNRSGIYSVSGYRHLRLNETGYILQFQNISNVIGQTVVVATAAIGMTFIIVSAGIDLSVGSVIALAGVLCYHDHDRAYRHILDCLGASRRTYNRCSLRLGNRLHDHQKDAWLRLSLPWG